MIDVNRLEKSYGDVQALRDVSFQINEGEIVGLLGPNGAGKTTIIEALARHSSVLFSTHILPEVEVLCDRVIILINGEIKADARRSELAETNNAILILDGRTPNTEQALRELDGVSNVELLPSDDGRSTYRIIGTPEADLTPAIYRLAAESGWPVRELRHDTHTLEAVFNRLALAVGAESDELDEEENWSADAAQG